MRLLVVVLAVSVIADGAFAQKKGRKLPEKAYIESAQIAIVSGDTTRYREAIAMLDSLFMNYGMHPEGYYWMNQIAVDFIEKTSGLKNKEPWVYKMVAYRDSLHIACGALYVKEKYKKECKKFIERADSTAVKYSRVVYIDAHRQFLSIEEALKEIKADTDSTTKAFYMAKVDANADSALANMKLSIMIDSTNGPAYLLAGTVLEKQGNYPASNEWLERGLKYVADSTQLLLQIAYNNIQESKYCEAIPYFKQYVSHVPTDTGTLLNLTICYNNCKMYDSAAMVHQQILGLDPNQSDALVGLGQYFKQLGIFANDSSSAYREKGNEAASKKWIDERVRLFDSSKVYFKRAHLANPNDLIAAEEFAIVAYVSSDFASAASAYQRLSEIEPSKKDHWISLGDSQLSLAKWKEAIVAYEKAVELDPDQRPVWEKLAMLYDQEKMSAKAAEARQHLK
jgi:tetratricopeptide (TPR) repeat protein